MKNDSKPVLTWSDQFATGLEDVDRQHQVLVRIINTLGDLRARHAPAGELGVVLQQLRHYTVYHFLAEDELMDAWPVDPAHKALHQEAHRSFIERIDKAAELVATDSSDVVDHLLAFLVKWLVHHIANTDARMAREIEALRHDGVVPDDSAMPLHVELAKTVGDLYDGMGMRTFEMLELNRQLREEIRQRQAIEQELTEARDAATASARAKSEFIARMSHEIRTPMNGILGMIELACDTDLTSEQREYLESARSSADALLTVINDILDFSKTEAHKLALEELPFDLHKQLHDLALPLTLRARQKGLSFGIDIEPDVPPFLVGDMSRLRQVMLNLVYNALKFTEQGGIRVRVALEHADATTVDLLFAVSDTGIGIEPGKLGAIFQPFSQADNSITRRYGGSGLGLTICETLVKLMQGRIWVESTPGQGSTFLFSVRLGRAPGDVLVPDEQGDRDVPRPAPGRPLCVLLAEDNPVNQKFVLAVLHKAGHQARLAQNGQEAVDCARAEPFDVILMDIQMPVMDGLTATRRIRELGIATPVIAITAHTIPSMREALADAGVDDALGKPMQAKALLGKLEAVASGQVRCMERELNAAAAGSQRSVVDMEEALRIVDGDQEDLRTLAQLVLDQIEAEMPLIRMHVAALDSAGLKAKAHSLKGSFGSVGARSAYDACKRLDELAADAGATSFANACAALEQEVERLRPALREIATGKQTYREWQ